MGDILQKDQQYIAGTYARFPVEIVSGKGSVLVDADGKEYIDMGSGIGVTAFGLADEEWVAAVTKQLNLVQHTSNLYYTDPCASLAKILCERTGMEKVFFSNSGAEANECAIKVARKYAADKKGADHYTILTMKNSFHGRTLTTLAATGQDHYHELYQPLTGGFVSVTPGDLDELKRVAIETKAAGILLECVQGEGGVVALSPDYIRAVADFAEKEDIVLMIDEVQTGNGRTGKLYAYMNFGIMPDVVSTAKGLGGGLPIGATILSKKVATVLAPGDHGSTFGGNPVCCAGACNVLSRLDDALLAEVAEKAELVREELKNAPGIRSVSGMGLMIGIETVAPAADIVKACIPKGVLCLTAKNKVRLLPALNIPTETLVKALQIIKETAEELS